jgi:hypothetical protein
MRYLPSTIDETGNPHAANSAIQSQNLQDDSRNSKLGRPAEDPQLWKEEPIRRSTA